MTTATLADEVTAEAIERAASHADVAWKTAARHAVWELIKAGEPFTTDDVWSQLDQTDVETHEPRALGAVVLAAARGGYVVNTQTTRRSVRPDCHKRPMTVWQPVRPIPAPRAAS